MRLVPLCCCNVPASAAWQTYGKVIVSRCSTHQGLLWTDGSHKFMLCRITCPFCHLHLHCFLRAEPNTLLLCFAGSCARLKRERRWWPPSHLRQRMGLSNSSCTAFGIKVSALGTAEAQSYLVAKSKVLLCNSLYVARCKRLHLLRSFANDASSSS